MMEETDWEEHISVDPDICHGKPCIKGTRVLVATVVASLEDGMTADEILGYYPSIPPESVQALAQYVENTQLATAANTAIPELDFQ